ncbi:MAG: hypothetical protein EA371_07410 [Gammaproteobacteria bacterium]|nr:MAG: hypothetical protein EA371_07410 [Gammaproteobacteria bacterium]
MEILHEIEPGEGPCADCRGTLIPISEKVSEQLDIQLARIGVALPRSALGKAMHYAHHQWPKLTVYVEAIEALLPLRDDTSPVAQTRQPVSWRTVRRP